MPFRLPTLTATGGAIQRAQRRLRAFDEARTDRQFLACRCARSDTPFAAAFIRQRGKPRYALEAVREQETAHEPRAAGVAAATAHDIRHFELSALICPQCGERQFTKCARCGAFVCNGRSERRRGGLYFRCASSCGSEGSIGTLEFIETIGPARAPQLAQGGTPLRLPKPKP